MEKRELNSVGTPCICRTHTLLIISDNVNSIHIRILFHVEDSKYLEASINQYTSNSFPFSICPDLLSNNLITLEKLHSSRPFRSISLVLLSQIGYPKIFQKPCSYRFRIFLLTNKIARIHVMKTYSCISISHSS